jgi:hypothetical protein
MIQQPITVHAVWDDEAAVFVATSDDVPGLVAEARDFDALHEKLAVLIPELLALNRQGPDGDDESVVRDVPLVVEWQQKSTIRLGV